MNQKDAINLLSLIGGLLVTIVILAAFNAYVIITPGQAGVLSVLGKAKDGVLLEGLHFKPPFVSSVDIYDVTVQKFEVPAQSSTKDLQDLSASFAINFRLDPTQVVVIRRTQGTLQNIVAKIIAPQTQESFKIAAAKRTVEEAITRRSELKEDFDNALSTRLEKYGILVAQAEVNRAKGKAEAQRLLAETLKEQGGGLVLQKEAIEAWREGGAQMPRVLVMDGSGKNSVPFLFNYSDSFPENTP